MNANNQPEYGAIYEALPDYAQRVFVESLELAEKMGKLNSLLENEAVLKDMLDSGRITHAEVKLLQRQYAVMVEYQMTLATRLGYMVSKLK